MTEHRKRYVSKDVFKNVGKRAPSAAKAAPKPAPSASKTSPSPSKPTGAAYLKNRTERRYQQIDRALNPKKDQ